MSTQPPRSLQDILRRQREDLFVGRADERTLFEANLQLSAEDERRRFVFAVSGQGGVGKTALLNRFAAIAEQRGYATAKVDDEQTDITLTMAQLAKSLEQQKLELKQFQERYKVYQQKRQEIENDPEAPPGMVAYLASTAARIGIIALKEVPIARTALGLVDTDGVIDQVGQFASYVAKRLTNQDEVRLLREPVEVLTPLFVQGLEAAAGKRPIALFFDVYERTSVFLDSWLRDLIEGEKYGRIPLNIIFTIAGREGLNRNEWADYEGLIARITLGPLSHDEAADYLRRRDIKDTAIVDRLIESSARVPLLLVTLAGQPPRSAAEAADVSATAIARMLQWIDTPAQRRVALLAAFPRRLDRDVLAVLVGTEQAEAQFTWLRSQPFVIERPDGWTYHDTMRPQLLRHSRRESPGEWAQRHQDLASFYQKQADARELSEADRWRSDRWKAATLEVSYHSLVAEPEEQVAGQLNRAMRTLDRDGAFARELATAMGQAGRDTGDVTLVSWADRLTSVMDAVANDRPADGIAAFAALIERAPLDATARAVALHWRGRLHLQAESYAEAETDFGAAIELAPDEAIYRSMRGIPLFLRGAFAEAMADFDAADALVAGTTPFTLRAHALAAVDRLDEALFAFDQAVATQPDNAQLLAPRAHVKLRSGDFSGALEDLDRAIASEPQQLTLRAFRSLVLRELGRADEAIDEFASVAENAEQYIKEVGASLATMPKAYLEHGLPKFFVSMGDDPSVRSALDGILTDPAAAARAIRAEANVLLAKRAAGKGDFDAALALLSRAIDATPTNIVLLSVRSDVRATRGDLPGALADLAEVRRLNPNNMPALRRTAILLLQTGQVEAAQRCADVAATMQIDDAASYAARAYLFMLLGRLDDSIADLSEAIERDPDNLIQRVTRGELQVGRGDLAAALVDYDVVASQATVLQAQMRAERAFSSLELLQQSSTLALKPMAEANTIARFHALLWSDDKDAFANSVRADTELLRAQVAAQTEDARAVFEALTAAIKYEPERADRWRVRGRFLSDRGEMQAALPDLSRSLELDEGDAQTWYMRGESNRVLGMLEDALRDFDRCIALDPAHAVAIGSRGQTLRQLGRYDEAIVELDRALDIADPAPSWLLTERGFTRRKLGQLDEALADFDAAIALTPTRAAPRIGRAITYLDKRDLENTLADLDVALQAEPDNTDTRLMRSRINRVVGRGRDALADAELVVAKSPDDAWSLYGRGTARRLVGMMEDALADLIRAAQLLPDDEEIPSALAEVYAAHNQLDAAFTAINHAIQLETASAEPHFARGLLELRRGNRNEAMQDFRSAMTKLEAQRAQATDWALDLDFALCQLLIGETAQARRAIDVTLSRPEAGWSRQAYLVRRLEELLQVIPDEPAVRDLHTTLSAPMLAH